MTTQKLKPDLKQIPVELLKRGKFQPRKEFAKESLEELAKSIQSAGLIQPIVVRPTKSGDYEIVAGERRWRAAQLAGLDTIACLVNHYSDEQTAAVATIENINRVDLNPIEEAQAYQRLIEEFNYSHEELAAIIGKSRVKITNSLRLLKLAPAIQQFLIDDILSEGHGKVLASLPQKQQLLIADMAIKKDYSVRRIEQEIKKLNQEISITKTEKDFDVAHLETELSDYVGCQVKIDFEDRKGQLTIDFHNLEILEGVLEKLGFKQEISK